MDFKEIENFKEFDSEDMHAAIVEIKSIVEEFVDQEPLEGLKWKPIDDAAKVDQKFVCLLLKTTTQLILQSLGCWVSELGYFCYTDKDTSGNWEQVSAEIVGYFEIPKAADSLDFILKLEARKNEN